MADEESVLEQILEALTKERTPGSRPIPGRELQATAELVAEDTVSALRFIQSLFPSGIPSDSSFFSGLHELLRHLGASSETYLLTGEIWVQSFKNLSSNQQKTILSTLPQSPHFFEFLSSLPVVISKITIGPDYLIPWFVKLRQRIGNDLAQGDYWRSLAIWAIKQPMDAFSGFRILLNSPLDDETVSIAACLLGNLRISWESIPADEEAQAFVQGLVHHPNVWYRLTFHRSWINTAWGRNLTEDEFRSCLDSMSKGTEEEKVESFNFLRCLLPSDNITVSSLEYGIDWLGSNANVSLSDNSKHWIVKAVCSTAQKQLKPSIRIRLKKPLVAIQPISIKNAGTWREIEGLLVNFVERDQIEFKEILFALLDSNPEGLTYYFTSPNNFEWLLSEMQGRLETAFFVSLFFSHEHHRRRFAFVLFDEMPFTKFPDQLLESRNEDEVALILLELRLIHLSPESIPKLLLSILPRINGSSSALQQLFEQEMLYHAKNFPRACLDSFKNHPVKNELLNSVVAEAEAYFDALRKSHRSSLTSMEVPSLQRALRIRAVRQGREIHQKSREMSIFANLFSTSYLLYGGKNYRYCRDGEFDELSELHSYSAEAELPRLEMIDPEGTAIRRHQTVRLIERIEARLSGKEMPDDD